MNTISIRIRLFAIPSAQVPRSMLGLSECGCSFPLPRASRLIIIQPEYGCSPVSPPDCRNRCFFNRNTAVRLSLPRASRLLLFNQISAVRLFLGPKVEIGDVPISIRLSAIPSARASRLMMLQSKCGCSPFPPTDRRDRCCINRNTAARLSLPRASRLTLLNQKTAVRPFSRSEGWDW